MHDTTSKPKGTAADTSITGSLEQQSDTVTRAMSERLRSIANASRSGELHRKADRLKRCDAGIGHRCGQVCCPRCAVQRAKRYRRRLEEKLRAISPRTKLVFITATLSATSVRDGVRMLVDLLGHLRRRTAWTAIVGGEQFVQVEPTIRRGLFNVHAHMICERADGVRLSVRALRADWQDLAGGHGMSGSFDCRPVHRRWARP